MQINVEQELIEEQKRVEANLVAMAYKYPRYAVHALHWLQPAMWINERYGQFWRGIRESITPNMGEYDAGKVATQAWLGAGLNMNGSFSHFVDIPDMDMETLADRVKELRYLLDSYERSMDVVKAIQDRDASRVRLAIEGFEKYRNAESGNMHSSDDVSDAFIAALNEDNLAVPTGIIGINNAIGGWIVKNAHVIAGRPSMGKTAIGLQCARNVAHQKKRAGYFSLEMSKEALWARMACPKIGVSWKDVVNRSITRAQRERLKVESARLAEQYRGMLFIDDRTYQTVDTVWEKVIKNELDIIFIDHLRLMSDRPELNEVKRLGYISKEFKNMAKSLEIPVVYLAQLSRKTEGRDNKRPTLQDLRDSGEIEENADTILMMYRDEYYTEGADAGGITELWVRKFRDGLRNSKIELEFDIKNEWFDSPQRETATSTVSKYLSEVVS